MAPLSFQISKVEWHVLRDALHCGGTRLASSGCSAYMYCWLTAAAGLGSLDCHAQKPWRLLWHCQVGWHSCALMLCMHGGGPPGVEVLGPCMVRMLQVFTLSPCVGIPWECRVLSMAVQTVVGASCRTVRLGETTSCCNDCTLLSTAWAWQTPGAGVEAHRNPGGHGLPDNLWQSMPSSFSLVAGPGRVACLW
jgi:hypothetical protein